MTLWAVIPLRGFALAKTRLVPALDEQARFSLNRRLFNRIAGCASEAVGADRVLVVSPDSAVIAAAEALGLFGLQEPDGVGLNGALQLAKRVVETKGATAILSLSCDLPCLTAADLTFAREAWPGLGAVILASDEAGAGTNALIVPAQADFAYEMGSCSAARHRAAAQRASLTVVEVKRYGLNFDLDTPADLARWRACSTHPSGDGRVRVEA